MNIGGVLNDLAACLCAQIETRGGPQPCFCGVIPGDGVIAEYAADCTTRNGVAWVRTGSMYPSVTPGVADQRPGNCATGTGIDIEIGILREQQAYMESDVITAQQAAAAVDLQLKDAETIRLAIECCSALNTEDYVLGLYAPMGPLGGLVGGAWTIHLSLI